MQKAFPYNVIIHVEQEINNGHTESYNFHLKPNERKSEIILKMNKEKDGIKDKYFQII